MVVMNLVRQLLLLVLSGNCSIVRLCAMVWNKAYTFLLSQSQDMTMLKRKQTFKRQALYEQTYLQMKNCRKVLLPLRESKITVILFSGCNPTGHRKLFALDSIIVHDNCTTNKSLMHQSGKGSLKFKSFFSCFLFKLFGAVCY